MQYIFIFESIGTSELMLIGLVAMIIFGPRKIPELAKTIGKVMTEFRRSTDDFKKTWEREAGFNEGESSIETGLNKMLGRTEEVTVPKNENLSKPEVKKISQEDFEKSFPKEKINVPEKIGENLTDKSNWL